MVAAGLLPAGIVTLVLVTVSVGATVLFRTLPASAQDARPVRLTVEAGDHDRIQTPVSFELRHDVSVVDESGRSVALQRGPDGHYHFIVDHLSAGAARTYTIHPRPSGSGAARLDPPVALSRKGGSITFSPGGDALITYHSQPTTPPRDDVDPVYRRGGYIHPVYSPSGVLLTDDYPPNHLHHHGIWSAWTKTVFQGRTPDFWNMGHRTGTVEPVGLDSVWTGPVFAGLQARHRFVDLTAAPDPMTALLEEWMLSVYPAGDGIRMFELAIVQETAQDAALKLPDYHYGGVGFRGHRQWNGAENAHFLTSEGRNRSDGHATRARWCHIGGFVDGRLAGLAVLSHPDNFRSPQPMRIHPDEPFFNYAPSQLGDWSIEPGDVYRARYRFVTYDGEADAALLDRLWNDFAHPPVVHIEYE